MISSLSASDEFVPSMLMLSPNDIEASDGVICAIGRVLAVIVIRVGYLLASPSFTMS